ncbi:hypothetical protein ACOME3_009199 [Neoechinorhynchus agilis]
MVSLSPVKSEIRQVQSFNQEFDTISPLDKHRRQRQQRSKTTVCCNKSKCAKCFKTFVAFLFSRIGLSILMIGYIVMGGWLFQTLELQNEVNVKREMKTILDGKIQLLWREILRKQESKTSDINFTRSATRILTDYEERLIRNIKSGYNGLDDSDDVEWSFFGAVLYATTLISTIGYGHVTCKTVAGKSLTVIYCIVGIPLMMLFSANIGSSMAASFRFLLKRSVVPLRRKTNYRDEENIDGIATADSEGQQNLPNAVQSSSISTEAKLQMEHDALRRIDEMILRQTDKVDDRINSCYLVEGSKESLTPAIVTTFEARLDNLIDQWGIVGGINRQGSFSVEHTDSFQRLGEANMTTNPESRKVRFASEGRPQKHYLSSNHTLNDGAAAIGGGGGRHRGDAMRPGRFLPIPSALSTASSSKLNGSSSSPDIMLLPMAITLFFSYVLLGAALFAAWEEDWSFLNSFYFCFVTLTTIGFGDFVPGKTINARTSPTKFIIATCYIIFGLVLIGMCFDLVKERFRQYIKSFASKIAISRR